MFAPDETRRGLDSLRLQALMDAAVDAIILIDRRGQVLDCNQLALKMFGYTSQELRGKNIKLLMPASYAREHDGYLARYLETGQARIIGSGREVTARRAGGEEFPIDLAVGVVRDGDDVVGFAGFIHDLTETKEVELRLHQKEQELAEQRERLMHAGRLGTMGEMAAGIAHEVNQPLTAIANYARASIRMLKMPDSSPERLAETLDKIALQAERAGEVIRGLRRFTRKQSQPMRSVELGALLRESRPLLKIEGRKSAYEIELSLPEQHAWVKAEPVQLQQVLLNLVRNAIDAMDEGGGSRVQIRLQSVARQWWHLEIEDDGPGISDELQQELFHPFVTSKADGVGLGLSICRSIAIAHGGALSCESGEPGKTIFRLILPAIDRECENGE